MSCFLLARVHLFGKVHRPLILFLNLWVYRTDYTSLNLGIHQSEGECKFWYSVSHCMSLTVRRISDQNNQCPLLSILHGSAASGFRSTLRCYC